MEIVDSNHLRATNLKYTNDFTEITYAHELAEQIRQEMLRTTDSDIRQEFLRNVESALSFIGNGIEVYGFCFCQSEQLLSQWRSYAQEGRGHAIGFSAQALETRLQVSADLPGLRLLKVLYDREEQIRSIRFALEKICDSVARDDSDGTYDHIQNIAHHHSLTVVRIAPYLVSFKNPVFEAEKEWRLVYIDFPFREKGLLKFRRSGSQLVPFVEFSPSVEEVMPISTVWLGPQVDSQLGRMSLRLLLYERGYERVDIKECEIPFRSF